MNDQRELLQGSQVSLVIPVAILSDLPNAWPVQLVCATGGSGLSLALDKVI